MILRPASKPKLTLYTRRGCGLCDEMKGVIGEVIHEFAADFEEIDVDSDPELRERFGTEVPVLLINGHQVFKYRVTRARLQRRLRRVC